MAIVAGQTYTLVIKEGWPDAQGQPMKAAFRKVFAGAPPDRISPDPESWIVKPPAAGTNEPLLIDWTWRERKSGGYLTWMSLRRPIAGSKCGR